MRTPSLRQYKTELFGAAKEKLPGATPASRRDRKRADIVAAAKEVFFEEGYAGASMDRITGRSRVSKATVYAHFRSKDDLLIAVVENVLQTIRSAMTHLPADGDFREWLTQFGRHAATQMTSPDAVALQRLAITEAARIPEIARALQQARAGAALAIVVMPTFEAAIANGILRKCDARTAISHFVEMCFGKFLRDMLMGIAPGPSAREIESHVRRTVDAFLEGYAATQSAA